jgi:hypothetical protein
MWMAEPRRDALVREICGVPGGCINQCLGCIGKANAIIQLYEGAEGAVNPRSDQLKIVHDFFVGSINRNQKFLVANYDGVIVGIFLSQGIMEIVALFPYRINRVPFLEHGMFVHGLLHVFAALPSTTGPARTTAQPAH